MHQGGSSAAAVLLGFLTYDNFRSVKAPLLALPFAGVTASKACAKSEMRSSVPSIPTESLIRDSDMPAACTNRKLSSQLM
jgi:hypothetical protein